MAIVLCTHGQRAVEQRPRIAAKKGVSDTVSHWRTRTARNHMPAGPGCQRGLVFCGQVQGEKAMTKSHQGHRRWALSSTFVALSQHGSKAGSNDSSGTAAENRRCEGCIRHRFAGAPGPPEATCHRGHMLAEAVNRASTCR